MEILTQAGHINPTLMRAKPIVRGRVGLEQMYLPTTLIGAMIILVALVIGVCAKILPIQMMGKSLMQMKNCIRQYLTALVGVVV